MSRVISPMYVYNDTDLERAMDAKETIIVSKNKKFFEEIVALYPQKQTADNIQKTGTLLRKAGRTAFAVSLFIPGLSGAVLMGELATAGIGGITKLVGSHADRFKKYNVVIDYDTQLVIFIRTQGLNAYKRNKDTVEGLDLEKIFEKYE